MVYTDHKALCSLLTSDSLNSRLKRMAMKLQPWMVTIVYKPWLENSMADALSRQEWRLQDEEDELSSGAGGPRPSSDVSGAIRSPTGAGGCEGPALTGKELRSMQKNRGERWKDMASKKE